MTTVRPDSADWPPKAGDTVYVRSKPPLRGTVVSVVQPSANPYSVRVFDEWKDRPQPHGPQVWSLRLSDLMPASAVDRLGKLAEDGDGDDDDG